MVSECPSAVGLLAGSLKHCRVGAVNVAVAGTSTKSLEFQKANEWAGSNHQGHNFNPSHRA